MPLLLSLGACKQSKKAVLGLDLVGFVSDIKGSRHMPWDWIDWQLFWGED